MNSPRPTQRELARRAGVTQATVSLALSGHPRISPDIRARVRELAAEIGYLPDPYLSGLSAYRKRQRPSKFQATLAWISTYSEEKDDWRRVPTFASYYEGARTRAGELGYRLEEHFLGQPGMTSRRLEQILSARNIPGVIFAPQPRSDTKLDFQLDRFSSVSFGYTLAEPRTHRVTSHQYRSMVIICEHLSRLGYRKPGLAIEWENDARVDRLWSSAFLSEQKFSPHSFKKVPPLIAKTMTEEKFLSWFHRHQPDVIISVWDQVYPWLSKAGYRVPDDVGLALLSVYDEGRRYSGIRESPFFLGARAIEFLIDLIHRGERGEAEMRSYLMIDGSWTDGVTLQKQD